MREGRCEVFRQHEGSEPILGGFQLFGEAPVGTGSLGPSAQLEQCFCIPA